MSVLAQPAGNQSLVGTLAGVRAGAGGIEVRGDNGETVLVKLGPDTLVHRVAPGEKDLKKAQSIQVTDLALGDRLLVSFVPGLAEARRIVVMSASDLEKRREAERQDWIQRGVFGVVASVKGNEITLKTRSWRGEVTSTVTVADKTVFRRYAPDSVRFADAIVSSLAEVRAGDQLRARGHKRPDGLKVAAEEVVFGTFLTRAGSVTAVNLDAREVTVKDLETNKPLIIKLTADSQVKRMTQFPALMGSQGSGRPSAGSAGFGPMGQGGMEPGGAATRPGGPADLSQMLERMPAATLAELKVGEAVVVSSTRGASRQQVTAITLLANAEMLIRMATAESRGARAQGFSPSEGTGLGGILRSLSGLELSGMVP